MKLSKKIKYLLFSSIGIISVETAAIATLLIILKQDNNNLVVCNSTSNHLMNNIYVFNGSK